MPKFYNLTTDETLRRLRSSASGLTSDEVTRRLHHYGLNEVNVAGAKWWRKLLQPFANVMVGVLLLAGILSLLKGNKIDAIIIFAIIAVSAITDWVQQYSTDRILRALREREQDRVEVYRDGNTSAVPASQLVPGDIIILHEGQKIPSDARIIESINLNVDESMLTGESMSIRKQADVISGNQEVYDQANMLFSGSFVVVGTGQAVVTATGNDTEFGKLAKLAGTGNEQSPIQQKIDKLIRNVVVIIFALAAVVLIIELAQGQSWLDAVEFVLAFSVSAVPESLPIAIAAVLALGMRRMASRKALVRNMQAIENIGLTTTIATDKTGTLTRNELHVQDTWSPRYNPEAFALQASFCLNSSKGQGGDPLDKALVAYLQTKKIGDPTKTTKAELIRTLPFDYGWALSGNVWKFGRSYQIYLKGAPEKILRRCALSELERKQAKTKLLSYARSGYRVIACAKVDNCEPPANFSAVPRANWQLLGLLAIADELRPHVDRAVAEAQEAGVKVDMITGDHIETAFNIASTVGIANDKRQVYDCRKLMEMTPDQLAQTVSQTRVYARVTPEAKHKILTELNKQSITAMTGDGVNDVPALTQAHVGIAMGSGAAIAKEASDMVLLDNNFSSIVTAIRDGRTIIANIKRMLVYLLSTNAGEVLVTLGALLLGLPLPLVPVQILWINLATDTFLVIPLGVEPSRGDVMKRPPAQPNASLLSKFMLGQIVLSSLTIAAITLTVYTIFRSSYDLDYARSAVFMVLIVIQWVSAIIMRSSDSLSRILRTRNKAFTIALFGTMLLQLIVLLVPELRMSLHIEQIHEDTVGACLVAVFVLTVVMELYKKWGRRKGLAE